LSSKPIAASLSVLESGEQEEVLVVFSSVVLRRSSRDFVVWCEDPDSNLVFSGFRLSADDVFLVARRDGSRSGKSPSGL
jgi:hypothetical protein